MLDKSAKNNFELFSFSALIQLTRPKGLELRCSTLASDEIKFRNLFILLVAIGLWPSTNSTFSHLPFFNQAIR
jgi:hypothetical protein